MKTYKMRYVVIWGEGQTQHVETKTEVLKVVALLLNDYSNVKIKKL